MAKRTLKDSPPIRGLKREPRDTDASVQIGGAEAVVKTVVKKRRRQDNRLRITIANPEQLNELRRKLGITRPGVVNLALAHLAKEFLL